MDRASSFKSALENQDNSFDKIGQQLSDFYSVMQSSSQKVNRKLGLTSRARNVWQRTTSSLGNLLVAPPLEKNVYGSQRYVDYEDRGRTYRISDSDRNRSNRSPDIW